MTAALAGTRVLDISTLFAGPLAATAEEVGDTDGIAVQELAEDHGLALLSQSG